MAEMPQGPGTTTQGATSAQAAQNAQLDAQIEVEAKKAALRGLQQANGGEPAQAPEAPSPPGMPKTTVVIQKDGNTTVLENPTPEQLQQVGMAGSAPPSDPFARMDPGQITTLGIVAMLSGVAIVFMIISLFKRARSAPSSGESKEMAARMARIENAIESVAVEVERVSEAQRFTTKVLSEGAAQNVNVPEIMSAVLKNRGGA